MNLQNVFYKQLNQSLEWSYKHDRWRTYRTQITEFIANNLYKSDDLLVIGAGYLNDLDIKRLQKRVQSITLSDIDYEAMVYGLQQQGISKEQVDVITIDYTGLAKHNFFETLQSMFDNKLEANKIITYIQENLVCHDVCFEQKFTSIIMLPIYTQMFLPLFQSMIHSSNVLEYYTEGERSEITHIYLEQSAIMLGKFNQMIINTMTSKGSLYLVTDIIEMTDDLLVETSIMTDNQLISDSSRLQAYVASYWKTYGFGFSGYGIEDLKRKLQLDDIHFTMWPYSENRNMIVAYAKYTKPKLNS